MDSASDIHAEKAACRTEARAARCALGPATCAAAAAALGAQLLGLPELADPRVVLAYSATAEEISLEPTIAALRERGMAIALPRIEERGVLAIHLVEPGDPLVPGPLGIMEPAADAPRPDLGTLDAVLVPGVAFDELGTRLGFGGGFYDRLLPLLAGAVRIGVAYDEQLVEPLPREPHDALMDVVVTPTRAIRPRPYLDAATI